MHRIIENIGILMAVLLLVSSAAKATEMSGEIGIDIKSLSYETDYNDTTNAFSVGRSQSNHYAGLLVSGALINSHFANYSTNLKLYGAYFNSSTDDATDTEYIRPGLRGFYGQATFLPEKQFPFQIYRSSYRDYAVRYEANNRSERERLQPSLSILRRYKSDRNASGAVWQYTPSETVQLISEIKEETSQSSRIYDFGENLDIWVTYITSAARPGDTVYTVLVDNQMPDTADIQIVNLDSLDVNPGFPVMSIQDLPPDRSLTIYLFPGRTEIQIASGGFNPYYNIIDVDSNLVIAIKYRDPSAPNDIDQTRKAFTNQLQFGDDNSRGRNTLFYEYSDQNEAVQKQTSYLHNISNTAGYKFTDKVITNIYTSYQLNRTRIDTVSLQWNQTLVHQTTMNYMEKRGLSASLMHMFSRNSSYITNPSLPPKDIEDLADDTLASTMHNIMGRLSFPSRKWGHRFDLNTNVTMLSDNKRTLVEQADTSFIIETPYANNQYSGEVINSFKLLFSGVKWQPRHSFKYTRTSQENPTKNSQEVDTKFNLVGEKSTAFLGDIRLKSEYSYRDRWDDVGSDTKTRYLFDLMVMRRFGTGYRLSFLANQEWEVSGGSAPALSGGSTSESETLHKSSFKFDFSASPHANINLTGGIMLIKQGENSISKYSLAVNAVVPLIKLPLKTILLAESRQLAGQDPQTQFSIETKVSHRIRKISIVVQHVYQKEKLVFETYSINEIQGKVSRQFDVL